MVFTSRKSTCDWSSNSRIREQRLVEPLFFVDLLARNDDRRRCHCGPIRAGPTVRAWRPGHSSAGRRAGTNRRSSRPSKRLQVVAREHAAPIDDSDPLAEGLDLFHVMAGVNDGHAFGAQRPHAVEQMGPRLRIDAHRRLVEDHQARTVQQGHAEIQSAFHSAGKGFGPVVGPWSQPRALERLIDSLFEGRAL